jgi:hypothetical protein
MKVQRYARVAGALFLISLIAGGLGEAYIPSKIIAADALTTAANLKSHEFLFRLGFATFLIESLCDYARANPLRSAEAGKQATIVARRILWIDGDRAVCIRGTLLLRANADPERCSLSKNVLG